MPAGRVVGLDQASAKIRALGNVLQRPLTTILASEARVTAVSFARSSQPYGNDNSSLQRGLNRVSADIYKVFATPGKAFKDIAQRHPLKAQSFWKALEAGKVAQAQAILDKFGSSLRGVPIGRLDAETHRANRDSETGRVILKRPAAIVRNVAALSIYIKSRQQNVGLGKGGWADVARLLGSIRGVKADGIGSGWITGAKSQGKGRVDWTDLNGTTPRVKLTSTIDYADQILLQAERDIATRIARGRILKSLQVAIRKETSKLRRAA